MVGLGHDPPRVRPFQIGFRAIGTGFVAIAAESGRARLQNDPFRGRIGEVRAILRRLEVGRGRKQPRKRPGIP